MARKAAFLRPLHAAASLALLVAACSGASRVDDSLPACGQPVARGRGGVAMSGEAAGTGPVARQQAVAEALAEGLQPIVGISVRGELKVTTVLRERNDDVATSTDASRELQVAWGAAKVQDFRVKYCRASPGRTRADVVVPDAEIARLVRRTRHSTLALVHCTSNPHGTCTPDLLDRVRSMAQSAGLTVSDVVYVDSDPALAAAQQKAQKAGAFQALVLQLSASFDRTEDPYHVCRAQASARLWDTEDGKGLASAKPDGFGTDGGYKGMVYADRNTPRDACSKAIREAMKALDPLVAGWPATLVGEP